MDLDPSRVIEIYDGTGRQSGSGYLVAADLVLTAYHVISRNSAPFGAVTVRQLDADGLSDWMDVELAWPSTVPDVTAFPARDAALLRIVDPRWPKPENLAGVRWGRVAGNERVPFEALGFPDAEKRDDSSRDTWPARGEIDPLHGIKQSLLTAHVTRSAVPALSKQSGWSGMSGAAVFCGELLTAVLLMDHRVSDRPDLLRATPVQALLGLPGFRDVVRSAGLPVDTETLDVSPPAPPPPVSGWVQSGFSLLPRFPPEGFVGRAAELSSACALVGTGRILPVVGPEHTGKSAFIERLLADERFQGALPRDRPWRLLELDIPGGGTPYPILRRLAVVLDKSLDDFGELGNDGPSLAMKRSYLVDTVLAPLIFRHGLVLSIDLAGLGTDTEQVEIDLDHTLARPSFKKCVVLTASAVDLQADGQEQLRLMRAVRLGGLTTDEARLLLADVLRQHGIAIDATEALSLADDEIVRRPRVLQMGADRYARRYDGAADAKTAQDALAMELIDACRITVADSFAEAGCFLLQPDGEAGALAPLMVWALSDNQALPVTVLDAIGVNRASREILLENRVLLEQPAAGNGRQTSTPSFAFGTASQEALRNLLLDYAKGVPNRRLKDSELALLGTPAAERSVIDGSLTEGADQLFQELFAYASGEEEGQVQQAYVFSIENTMGWIRKHDMVGALPGLVAALTRYAVSHSVEDLFPPFLEPVGTGPVSIVEQLGTGTLRTSPNQLLYGAVADANMAMRAEFSANAAERFTTACRVAVEALRSCMPDTPAGMIRAMDAVFFHGARRFNCAAEIVALRADLIPVLREHALPRTAGRVGRTVWAASWVLNTAELRFDTGSVDDGRACTRTADELLSDLPEPDSIRGLLTQAWLRVRLSSAVARGSAGPEERLMALRDSWDHCRQAVRACAFAPDKIDLWTQRFLNASRDYGIELRYDTERSLVVSDTVALLEETYGPHTDWKLHIRAGAARFLRQLLRRQSDPAFRLAGAEQALDIFSACEEEAMQRADYGETDVLLELAHTHDFHALALAENERMRDAFDAIRKAEQLAEYAMRAAPSAHSYLAWLLNLHQRESWQVKAGDGHRYPDGQRAAEAARRWLAGERVVNLSHARLSLWCIKEEWHRHGISLFGAAKELNPQANAADIARIYRKRTATLDGHEKQYLPMVEVFLARAELEREYQRLRVTHGKGSRSRIVDYGRVVKIFRAAKELWPYDYRVHFAEANFQTYTWNYRQAAEDYLAISRSARNGYDRGQAQVKFAQSLLYHVQYDRLTDLEDRDHLLRLARNSLSDSLLHSFVPGGIAVLKERINLELGDEIDWDALHSVFRDLIGIDYLATVNSYLDGRWRDGPPENGAESIPREDQRIEHMLRADFDDDIIIHGFGLLYLRNSETTDDEPTAALHARYAYACFDACRIWQDLTIQRNSANRYLRARSILLAATHTRSMNPFEWEPEKKDSWLELAEYLLESCINGATGRFYEECSRKLADARRLLRSLR